MFGWRPHDVENFHRAQFLIGADIVYDDELTVSLVAFLLLFFRRDCAHTSASASTEDVNAPAAFIAPDPHSRVRVALFALEERHVFLAGAMRDAVPALECFLAECAAHRLCVQRLDLARLPQYVDYQRSPQLTLLRVTDSCA